MSEPNLKLVEFNFDQQLDHIEQMLHRTNVYKHKLSIQIDYLKMLLKCNQSSVDRLLSNELSLGSILKNGQELDLPTRNSKRFERSESKISQRLFYLELKLNAIGKELKQLHKTGLIKPEKVCPSQRTCKVPNIKEICWTPCKTTTEGSQIYDLPELERDKVKGDFKPRQTELPLPDLHNHQDLINRVKIILATAENLKIKSETLTNVKVLCKLLLRALNKRMEVYKRSLSMEKTKSDFNLSRNPYF